MTVFDICDYCNGPIIGVRRYDRQDPTTFYNENPDEISEDKIEFYIKDNKTEDSKL